MWLTLRPLFAFLLLADASYDSSSISSRTANASSSNASNSGSSSLSAARSLLLSQLLALASCDEAAAELVVPLVLQQLRVWRSSSGADR